MSNCCFQAAAGVMFVIKGGRPVGELSEVARSQGHVGTGWYRREQWARLRQIATEPEKLHERYEDWLASAQRVLLQLNAGGTPAKRVDIDVEQLREWCHAPGRPVDGAARSEFAALRLQQRDQANRGGDV